MVERKEFESREKGTRSKEKIRVAYVFLPELLPGGPESGREGMFPEKLNHGPKLFGKSGLHDNFSSLTRPTDSGKVQSDLPSQRLLLLGITSVALFDC